VHCAYKHEQVGFQFGLVRLFDSEVDAFTRLAEINLVGGTGCSAKKECTSRNHLYMDLSAVAR
jgi:hypothetical protein